MRSFASVFMILWVPFYLTPGADSLKVDKRLDRAAELMTQIMGAPDSGVPRDLLNKALCIGVVPSEKRLAFGVESDYGRGAVVCRRHGDGAWGPPWMFTMGGGSFGFQISGESTDVIFTVMNADGARKLVRENVKLGADVSVAAGPVGREAIAATDAEILGYSRSRGLFGGLALNGAVVKQDHEGNRELYGRDVSAREILFSSEVQVPAAAVTLDKALTEYSPRGGQPMP